MTIFKNKNDYEPFAFFGSSRFSVIVLEELEKAGILPTLVVTTPDKPQGRKLIITPNVVKTWAVQKGIPVLDPAKLDDESVQKLRISNLKLFVVASYGKIIPQTVLDIPENKTLNIHPSLLPKYRGASPLQSVIIADDKNTGISIMRIDEKMDHGPIIAQKNISVNEWPTYENFEEQMAREGAKLLAQTIPGWIAGTIEEKEQDHSSATFTKKISKEDGQIDLTTDPYLNFRKIQAYHGWPTAFFFVERHGKKIRVKIVAASFKENQLVIEKVIPEGGREMEYEDWKRGMK